VGAPDHAAFAVVAGGGAYALGPGQTHAVTLRYAPDVAGDAAAVLEACGPVALRGEGFTAGECALSATALGFGDVGLGRTRCLDLVARNDGDGLIAGFAAASGDGFALVEGGGQYYLEPGGQRRFTVCFTPAIAGPAAGSLALGAACGNLPLAGAGVLLPPACETDATLLEMGSVPLGANAQRSFTVRNAGAGLLQGVVTLAGEHFALMAGAGPFALAEFESLAVTVRYAPTAPGVHVAQVDLGTGLCAPVACQGAAPLLTVSPDTVRFGEVPIGETAVRSLTLGNAGGGLLTGSLPTQLCGGPFRLQQGLPYLTYAIPAGGQLVVPVFYAPAAAGADTCVVAPVAGAAPLVFVGSAVWPPPQCGLSATVLDFGSVPVQAYRDLTLRISNPGITPLACAVASDSPHFTIRAGGGTFTLDAGSVRDVSVRFLPTAPGAWTGTITTGNSTCGDVACAGISPVPVCAVVDDSLAFGTVPLGGRMRRAVALRNEGPGVLVGRAVSPDPRFLITAGADYAVGQGGTVTLFVDFVPDAAGPASCVVDLGASCGGLPCAGTGIEMPALCAVAPATLDFGTVSPGRSCDLWLVVSNAGGDTLRGEVAVSGEGFSLPAGSAYSLAWREEARLPVRFAPISLGLHAGVAQAGPNCPSVTCTGEGAPLAQDVLGIYFDPDGGTNAHATAAPVEPVTAYLVLLQPSAPAGVSGWECCVEMVGGFTSPAWTLYAEGLNIDAPPCFQVGLPIVAYGAGQPAIPLARVSFVQLNPADATLFFLHPYRVPSLPGVPVYADGADPGHLVPLHWPGAGEEEPVATVNGGGAVPVLVPAPVVTCAEGGVRAAWDYDPSAADGCLLYRRERDGLAEPVTAALVSEVSGRVSLLDGGAPAGVALRYHYAVLRNGAEVARSAESEVTCAGLPPAGTALHPVFPNPFNPRANVRFDLARPGRARVTVHDVAGRRLRVLCDGELPAATHQREWDGRDERGRPQPSGTYYVRLEADGARVLRKVTLLR